MQRLGVEARGKGLARGARVWGGAKSMDWGSRGGGHG